jgi:Chain length determinant protein
LDLATLFRVLLRQWFVVLTALLIAGSAAFGAWMTADADYRADATVTVLPPQNDVDGQPQNPYDQISAKSNADLARLLALKLNGGQYRSVIGDQGLSTNYLVDNGDSTTPILRISVDTAVAEEAQETIDALVQAVGDELYNLQNRFVQDDGALYTVDVIDRTPRPVQRFGDRTRLTLSVLILGIGAAIAVAVFADNIERALRRRWSSPDQPSSGDGRGRRSRGVDAKQQPDVPSPAPSRSELGVPS